MLATLAPTMGCLLLQKYIQNGRKKGRGVLCSRFGCCLHYGHDVELSASWADPPSGPTITLNTFRDSGSSLLFLIKAGIGLSSLPLAPWQSLPAYVPCQVLIFLGLISGSSTPVMETGDGCCRKSTVQGHGVTAGR